jgi:hypothetical protein
MVSALAVGCPSANAKIFRMTCTPTDSVPYTVAYDSDAGVSYITGSRTGTTRKYHVLDVKDKSDVHVLYVATKAPNQTRTIYLAFDYSGMGDDVSVIRVVDGATDKKDKCAFIPNQIDPKAAPQQGPQSDQEQQQQESPAESALSEPSEKLLKIEEEKTKQAQEGESAPKNAEVADTIRQLPCEQVCQPVFPTQIGRPVMWGIPARGWGSREFSALANRINDCENLYLQARERNQARKGNQCGGLAGYVRRQFEQPRKDAEEREREAGLNTGLRKLVCGSRALEIIDTLMAGKY